MSNFLPRVVSAKLIAIMAEPRKMNQIYWDVGKRKWSHFFGKNHRNFQRVRLDMVKNGNYLIIGQSTPEDAGVSWFKYSATKTQTEEWFAKKIVFFHLSIPLLLESKLCEGRYPLVVQTTGIWPGSSNFGFGFWSLIYQANVSKHL